MEQPYVPISCQVHDEMLALATRRQECELTVESEDGSAEQVRGVIVDVYSRDGAEYLRLHDGRNYRLDRILRLDGEEVPPAG